MRSRWWRTLAVTALAGVGLVVVGWLVLSVLPSWAVGSTAQLSVTERETALSTARGQSITLVSALGALVLVGFGVDRHFLDKDKQRLDKDKHLTEQFDNAIGRLTSTDPLARVGGVRTLFRLMVTSPSDHMLVVASICDMLRLYAVPGASDGPRLPPELAAGVQALRDRPARPEPEPLNLCGVVLPESDWHGALLVGARFANHTSFADLSGANLSETDLTESECNLVQLRKANLRDARLIRADLTGADLTGAGLTGTDATGARLTNAVLRDVDLSGAKLCGADLRRARLHGARMGTGERWADLTGADLTETDLTGTDLSQVCGLTDAQVSSAIVDNGTKLPVGVNHPRLRRDPPQ